MIFRHIIFSSFVTFFSLNVFAIAPILPSLNESFPNPVLVTGGSYNITYTFKNQLPFTLIKPLIIEKQAIPSSEFSYTDNCTGKKLKPYELCTVKIFLDPTTGGYKYLTLTIVGYDNNRVPLPTQTTFASGASNVTINGEVITQLPSTLSVGQTGEFKFRFTNTGSGQATGVSVIGSTADFYTNCGSSLNAGAFCEANGTYTPTSATPTVQTVTGTFSFTQGEPVIESVSTTVTSTGLTGKVTEALPAITAVNSPHYVSFNFNNNSSSAVSVTGVYPSTTPSTNFTLDTSATTCCTGLTNCTTTPDLFSLPAHGACVIAGTFEWISALPSGLVTLTAGLTVASPPPDSVSVSTSTTVQSSIASHREIVLVNNCGFKVWFSLNGGAITDSPVCMSDAGCPTGTRCNTAAKLCFWDNYGPSTNSSGSNGSFELFANGGNATVNIPEPTDPIIYWSGAISASTGCNGSSTCITATCNNAGGSTACQPGVGFSQPATQAEFTLLKDGVDAYDVEVINGFHLPIEMSPIAPNSVIDYSCGSPGKSTATASFGACNWNNAVVPNNDLFWVSAGGVSCETDATCGSEICGLSRVNNIFSRVCGKFLGFWTADEVCGSNPNFTETVVQDFFNCDAYLGSPFPPNTYTLSQLYSCSPIGTCYDTNSTSQCCGCANWQDLSVTPTIILPQAPTTENCVAQNSIWISDVLPQLTWMKQACPMVYTYSFDDKSSSFTCQKGSPNTQGYTITFCPGTFSGLPSGKLEGRNG